MKHEIERKFLVKDFPKDMKIHKLHFIKQLYLKDGSRIRAVRELIYDKPLDFTSVSKLWMPPYGHTVLDFATHHIKYYHTIKKSTDNPLIREEDDQEVLYGEYFYKYMPGHESLIPIQKVRYHFYVDGIECTMDSYMHPEIQDLIEVEFETCEAAAAFMPHDWFGEEVTDNDKYKNKTIFEWLNKE